MELPLNDEHTLNVQAVEVRTGVTAETLRTWERRYGWPQPRRLPNGYRVYSEDDVSLILAVKRELDSGVAAATAWQRVLAVRQRRHNPDGGRGTDQLVVNLYEALMEFNAEAASGYLSEANALYPLERVLLEVVQPTLVEIGSRWHDGAVTATQEHFATNLLRDSLVTISSFYRPRPGAATLLIGSGPGELHDIGPLMLAVILRRNRHNVMYLGQNTAIENLCESMETIRPRMLVLSASRVETARSLLPIASMIQKMRPPRPLFAFGGRAFDGHAEIAERIGGTFIAGNAVQAADRIEELLSAGPQA